MFSTLNLYWIPPVSRDPVMFEQPGLHSSLCWEVLQCFSLIRKLLSSWLRYVAVLCLPDLFQLWYTVGSKSLLGAVWEVFIAGRLIGCLHGSAVTNKGCLNCASILLFQCTNRQWEAWRGHACRQMHVKLQSTLNAREYFTKAVTRGWVVCPAFKLWPSFLKMCYSS